jgi:antitoxin HicB
LSNNYVGSNFDDFLEEEGILAKTDVVAVKRVIAFHVKQMMKEQNLSKAEMSRWMNISRATLNHLLDPQKQAVTLQTLERAAHALGKRLQIYIA